MINASLFQNITFKTPSLNHHQMSPFPYHLIKRVIPNHSKNQLYHSYMQYSPMHTRHQ